MLRSQAGWRTPVTPGLRRLRREDHRESEASLGYIAGPCLQDLVSNETKQNKKKRKEGESMQRCTGTREVKVQEVTQEPGSSGSGSGRRRERRRRSQR